METKMHYKKETDQDLLNSALETLILTTPKLSKGSKRSLKYKSAPDGFGDEYEEQVTEEIKEQDNLLYDRRISLPHRLEFAIQRYRNKRKFSSIRQRIFESYLRFGGVKTGPKEFQGHGGKLNRKTKEEIFAEIAIDFIDDSNPEKLGDIDLPYVVQSYLSYHMSRKLGYWTMEYSREGPLVLENFINYLKIHSVMPEFEDQIEKSLEIIKKAKVELLLCIEISKMMPDELNEALGKYFESLDQEWKEEINMEILEKYFDLKTLSVEESSQEYERMEYISVEKETEKENTIIANFQTWYRDEEERKNGEIIKRQIRLEKSIVEKLLKGMIIDAIWHKLNTGLWYPHPIANIDPTFFYPQDEGNESEEGDDIEV